MRAYDLHRIARSRSETRPPVSKRVRTVPILTLVEPVVAWPGISNRPPLATLPIAESSVTGLTASLASKQPLDSDLTAIAALATTGYGRALLALADAAAGRTALSLGSAATASSAAFDAAGAASAAAAASQPLDSDLTAIAALATTAYGRAFLALADAAAARTALALGTLATQSGTFSGTSSGTNTGDQTVTLTGDVTGTGTGSFAATIANDAVTYAKMQNVSATSRLLGRVTAGAGDPEELTAAQVRSVCSLIPQARLALTADATGVTSATPANVTSLLFAVANGSYYVIEFEIVVRTDALTFSPVIGITTPTFTRLACTVTGPTGVAGQITASAGTVTVAALPAINTDYLILVKVQILPSANGNVQVQAAISAALGTLTIRQSTGGVQTLLA